MNRFFCCFKKKKKATISSYVEYYSNRDTMSETSITNSLLDAIKSDDEDKPTIIYSNNPLYPDKHETVVGGRNPPEKIEVGSVEGSR